MAKWYEEETADSSIYCASRIRLVRNIKGKLFPDKMSDADRLQLLEDFHSRVEELSAFIEKDIAYYRLDEMKPAQKLSFREHRVINSAICSMERPMALMCAEDDSESILCCGDDHLRIQVMLPGLSLQDAYTRADKLDDKLNEFYDYAFDEKFGYLTTFPTNTGTGLRASVYLHLPVLSRQKTFRKVGEYYGRFGVGIRPLFESENESYGAMYELFNQKTLGKSEMEIIALVKRMARQIAAEERKARNELLKESRLETLDETFKSYGILRYARTLGLKEALKYLSALRLGIMEGLVVCDRPVSVLEIIMNIMPGSIGTPDNSSLENCRRADYIRGKLAEITERTNG